VYKNTYHVHRAYPVL